MKPRNFVLSIAIVAGSCSAVLGGDLLGFEPGLEAADLWGGGGSSSRSASTDSLDPMAAWGPAPSIGLPSAVAPSVLGADLGHTGSYFSARIGPLWFIEDLEDLDVGLNAEIAFGFRPISLLAFEFQSGYFWGETDGSLDAELWGIPFLVNVKLIIPLWILELYAGGGLGGYYIDTEASVGGASSEDEDFVFGGNVFLGAGFVLGPVALGLEGKYLQTADFDAPGGGEASLQGFALMAYATFYF